MNLELDARQRAMLQEMGITVWAAPAARTAPTAQPPAARAEAPAPTRRPTATPTSAPASAVPAAAVARAAPQAPGTPASELRLNPPLALYPQADPAATPAELGGAWLIVLESPTPDQPLAGDVGRLLDNMLRAMRLHRHPRAFVAPLSRPGAGQEPAAGLQQALAALRPAVVLVLGLAAARAVLGSREPLGRLRAGTHQLADGTPAVVSYDPAYLLRAPEAKSAAWADLCRALALARPTDTR